MSFVQVCASAPVWQGNRWECASGWVIQEINPALVDALAALLAYTPEDLLSGVKWTLSAWLLGLGIGVAAAMVRRIHV